MIWIDVIWIDVIWIDGDVQWGRDGGGMMTMLL